MRLIAGKIKMIGPLPHKISFKNYKIARIYSSVGYLYA
jgi:hypothetical protein